MKLHYSISSQLDQQLKDMYFVGRFAKSEDLVGTSLLPINYQNEYSEYIQFQVKCLSEIPAELSDNFAYNNKIFAGSTRSPANYRMFEHILSNNTLSAVEKRDQIKEYLGNKVVLFKMKATTQYINIDLIELVEVDKIEAQYMIIPSPSLKTGETRTDFERKFSKERLSFTLPSYPIAFSEPEFLYLDGRIYTNFKLNQTYNVTTYNQQLIDEVEFLEADMVEIQEHVLFSWNSGINAVPFSYALSLRDHFEERGKHVHLSLEHQSKKAELPADVENEVVIEKKKEEDTESFFLQLLKDNAVQRGLYYTDEDLYNFHTCMKTNLLTIIGGMSGIGKSQLALLYAETLGMIHGKQVLMLPISPSYTEPNDLLGFLNPNTGIYNESETGLVSILRAAEEDALNKDTSKMHMIIFDEMNLAQVEHWFSPFISLLEMSEDKRYLHLFNENNHCVNNYKHRIHIGSNVLFVGTVNFDETTKIFSDRLLDRANVFIPDKPKLKNMYDKCYGGDSDDKKFEQFHSAREMYRKWTNANQSEAEKYKLTDKEIEIIDELHRLINEQDRQKGISFRTAKSIAYYLNNIPKKSKDELVINREDAFDLQIKQRVITKIRGIDSFVYPLFGSYDGQEWTEGSFTKYLKSPEVQDYHGFNRSLEVVESKMKELLHYGFAY